MHVTVISPERELYSGEAQRVKLPGKKGRFEVLNNHAPLVSSLVEGEVVVVEGSNVNQFPILSGFVEVLNNSVSVLVQEG